MRRKVIAVVSLMMLGAAASLSFAEERTSRFLPPEQVVLYLTAKLSLSEDQKAAISPIIAERQTKLKAALAERNAGTAQRRHEVADIFADTDVKINAILSPDQQQKYAAIERTMMQQLKQAT